MPAPSFFVGYPNGWIEKRPWLHKDNAALFKHIREILRQRGHKFKIGRIKMTSDEHDINLAHHTTIEKKNVWNIKKGYLPGYMYWDRTGYSGWAEMANYPGLFELSQDVDYEKAKEFFDRFSTNYIEGDVSKFPQKDTPGHDLRIKPENGKFSCPTPYVFVACQRPRDTVSKLARISTERLPNVVAEAFKDTGYTVVIKRHPQEKLMDITYLAKQPHVMFSQHSIHDIIPDSTAVITVNSGVGFEALLHRKPVYTSGHCDYHWATRPLQSKNDVLAMKETLNEPFEEERNVRFMYYMLNEYFVNAFNKESVEAKIDMCIKEWAE